MRISFIACLILVVAVTLAAQQKEDFTTNVNLGGGSTWRGEVPTGPVPRLPDGTVDLTGVWQGGGPGGSNGGLERGLAPGETIPILPMAKAAMAKRGPLDNTEALCLPADELDSEIERFRQAVRIAGQQIEDVKARLRAALGEEQSFILEPHLLMLEDSSLGRQVEQFIRENHANAEWAVREVADRFTEVYTEIADSYLRERSNDVEDVARRLISILSGTKTRDLNQLASDAIIVASDLLPSVAAELDPERVLGFVTVAGGSTSHCPTSRGNGRPLWSPLPSPSASNSFGRRR